jgi:hypothetical protein
MNSVRNKAVMEHRKLNQDEFKFLAEMEERNEALRQKYKSGDPMKLKKGEIREFELVEEGKR